MLEKVTSFFPESNSVVNESHNVLRESHNFARQSHNVRESRNVFIRKQQYCLRK